MQTKKPVYFMGGTDYSGTERRGNYRRGKQNGEPRIGSEAILPLQIHQLLAGGGWGPFHIVGPEAQWRRTLSDSGLERLLGTDIRVWDNRGSHPGTCFPIMKRIDRECGHRGQKGLLVTADELTTLPDIQYLRGVMDSEERASAVIVAPTDSSLMRAGFTKKTYFVRDHDGSFVRAAFPQIWALRLSRLRTDLIEHACAEFFADRGDGLKGKRAYGKVQRFARILRKSKASWDPGWYLRMLMAGPTVKYGNRPGESRLTRPPSLNRVGYIVNGLLTWRPLRWHEVRVHVGDAPTLAHDIDTPDEAKRHVRYLFTRPGEYLCPEVRRRLEPVRERIARLPSE